MTALAAKLGRRKKKDQTEYFFDYSLLFIVLFLLGFGLVMIYSTSSYEAAQEYDGDSAHYLKIQAIAVALGLLCMTVVANIPYHVWEKFAVLGYLVSIGMLLLLKVPRLAVSSHGATRWIRIPGIPLSLQPAEIAKLCMILFLATRNVKTFKGFLIMCIAPIPSFVMIWKISNNLSSAIIVFGISMLMVFVADPCYKKYVVIGIVGAVLAAGLVFLIINAESTEGMDFRSQRIAVWLNPESDPTDKGFQTLQALYAIGSGGIWGKGLGFYIIIILNLTDEHNYCDSGTPYRLCCRIFCLSLCP